jgi:hypothetical protein
MLPDSFNGITHVENSSQIGWREFFEDPLLSGLIDQALIDNQELNILAQEIQIARNEIRARRGEYFPFLTFGAGAGLEKPSRFTPQGAVEEQLEPFPGKSFPDPLPDWQDGQPRRFQRQDRRDRMVQRRVPVRGCPLQERRHEHHRLEIRRAGRGLDRDQFHQGQEQ